MKKIIIVFIILLALNIICRAESDTLVINLKNSQVDKIALSQIQLIKFENLTSIDEQSYITSSIISNGNKPNPFTEHTNIEFEIAITGNVKVMIYDNTGNLIKILECNECPPGKNTITWDCLDSRNNHVANGTYHYEVRFNNEIQSKNMILIR